MQITCVRWNLRGAYVGFKPLIFMLQPLVKFVITNPFEKVLSS
jgi:hypothetical protein